MSNPLRVIEQLYAEGGLDVCTADVNACPSSSADACQVVARTVIQLDGDVIHYVSKRVLSDGKIWREHLKKLEKEIHSIRRYRALLSLFKYFSVLPLAWAAYDLSTGRPTFLSGSGLVLGALMLSLRGLIVVSVRWHLDRVFRTRLRS